MFVPPRYIRMVLESFLSFPAVLYTVLYTSYVALSYVYVRVHDIHEYTIIYPQLFKLKPRNLLTYWTQLLRVELCKLRIVRRTFRASPNIPNLPRSLRTRLVHKQLFVYRRTVLVINHCILVHCAKKKLYGANIWRGFGTVKLQRLYFSGIVPYARSLRNRHWHHLKVNTYQ